jgi:membrane protease YdiL (CAAX protease family)
MIQTQAINPIQQAKTQIIESCPTLKTFQVQKVAAVGLACLLFFGLQASCPLTTTLAFAVSCSIITATYEAFVRKGASHNFDWFNTNIDKKLLMIHVALRLTVLPILIVLTSTCGIVPAQAIAAKILAGNLRIILLVTITAPLAEEILFRGFIQERLEDLVTLVNRFIYPLSNHFKAWFSVGAQSILFGAIHIIGGQVPVEEMKIAVFGATAFLGFCLGALKNEERSLIPAIGIHSAQNTGFTLGLLSTRLL